MVGGGRRKEVPNGKGEVREGSGRGGGIRGERGAGEEKR